MRYYFAAIAVAIALIACGGPHGSPFTPTANGAQIAIPAGTIPAMASDADAKSDRPVIAYLRTTQAHYRGKLTAHVIACDGSVTFAWWLDPDYGPYATAAFGTHATPTSLPRDCRMTLTERNGTVAAEARARYLFAHIRPAEIVFSARGPCAARAYWADGSPASNVPFPGGPTDRSGCYLYDRGTTKGQASLPIDDPAYLGAFRVHGLPCGGVRFSPVDPWSTIGGQAGFGPLAVANLLVKSAPTDCTIRIEEMRGYVLWEFRARVAEDEATVDVSEPGYAGVFFGRTVDCGESAALVPPPTHQGPIWFAQVVESSEPPSECEIVFRDDRHVVLRVRARALFAPKDAP